MTTDTVDQANFDIYLNVGTYIFSFFAGSFESLDSFTVFRLQQHSPFNNKMILEVKLLNYRTQYLKNGLRMQDGAITSLIHHERQAQSSMLLPAIMLKKTIRLDRYEFLSSNEEENNHRY